MRVAGLATFDVLPRRTWRVGREFEADAIDRRAVPAHAVLWFAGDDAMVDSPRLRRESQACAAADAGDGLGGDLPAATNQRACSGTSNLPLFIAESGDRTARPSVERGHHLCAAPARFHVPGGGARLAQPLRT